MIRARSRAVQTLAAVAALALTTVFADQQLTLPNQKDSIRFAVIGDSGTGGAEQYRVAQRLAAMRGVFPFDFVLMLGDNLYGAGTSLDYVEKFEKPYQPLLAANVKFYASLGNHDNTNERFYKPFNMNGDRYYTFKPTPSASVRFYALDSNYMDRAQLAWVERELANSGSDWKIAFFHHPIYSSGGFHGSDLRLREQLEPLFVKHSVDVVLSGHDHFYERTKPQQGVTYFVSGGAAKLRRGDARGAAFTEKEFDQGYHFMLIEIVDDTMHFQVISDLGQTVDSGVITRRPE
jgi:3',5'-cyclic AMP phosphodiesterase CpdA